MNEPLDLKKKRVIPEITFSVVENLGYDCRDKKQRKIPNHVHWHARKLNEALCGNNLFSVQRNNWKILKQLGKAQ